MNVINLLNPFLGRKSLQFVWQKLHRLSLYGMNYGRSGDIDTSGEQQVFKLIKKQFLRKASGVYLDCGANIGEYVLELVDNVNRNSLIYAFEPGRIPFSELELKTKALKNVKVVQKGVGDKNETLELYSNAVNTKHSSMFRRDMSHWGQEFSLAIPEKIEIIRLDQFLIEKGHEHIDFMKIDVEGFEMNCLKGLGAFLTEGRVDMIQFEFGVATIDAKVYFKDFFQLLNGQYKIYRILKDGFYLIHEYDEILEVFITTNYLVVSRKIEIAV